MILDPHEQTDIMVQILSGNTGVSAQEGIQPLMEVVHGLNVIDATNLGVAALVAATHTGFQSDQFNLFLLGEVIGKSLAAIGKHDGVIHQTILKGMGDHLSIGLTGTQNLGIAVTVAFHCTHDTGLGHVVGAIVGTTPIRCSRHHETLALFVIALVADGDVLFIRFDDARHDPVVLVVLQGVQDLMPPDKGGPDTDTAPKGAYL